MEAIYAAIKNGLANGPIFNETAVIDTATGGVASAVILDVYDIQVPTSHTKVVVDGEGGGGGDVGMVEKEASEVEVGMEVGEEMEVPMVEMQELEGLGEQVEQEHQVVMGGMVGMLDSLPLFSTTSALKMRMVLLFG